MYSWKPYAFAGLLMALIVQSAEAQKHSYQSFNGTVPFNFTIGDRKFHAGYYEFLVTGAGIMAMRDARAHVVAILITRQVQGIEREAPPHFVFERIGSHVRLASIWMEKGAQGYEIVKEELAMRPAPPAVVPDMNSGWKTALTRGATPK